jgi:thiol-disulfide isomerase/thioredoxin
MAKAARIGTVGAVALAVASALVGLAAVYVTLGPTDNEVRAQTSTPSAPAAALPSGPGSNALSRGDMTAFVFKKEPQPLPEFTFFDAAGKSRSLKEWEGKVVLLNLWATWCVPCRKEMPALDALQKELGSDKFEVVALAVDRTGAEGARKFLEQIGIKSLQLYVDPSARAAIDLKAVGLPATLLLDREGREIGRLLGPAEWAGEDAKRLIGAVLG